MNLTNATAGTRGHIVYGLVFCLAIAATGTLGFVVAPGVSKPQEREFTVVTTKYAYEPAVIRVNKGERRATRSSSRHHTTRFEGSITGSRFFIDD